MILPQFIEICINAPYPDISIQKLYKMIYYDLFLRWLNMYIHKFNYNMYTVPVVYCVI